MKKNKTPRLLLASTLAGSGHKLLNIIPDIKDKNILCIPSAALVEEGHENWLPNEKRDVKTLCKNYLEFDLKGKSEQDLRNALIDMDIVYCTGGNTFCLLEYMRASNFKYVLHDFFDEGGIYFGSSAGSIVMGPDIGFAAPVDNVSLASLKNYIGLNMVDFYIMPHSNQEKFLKPVKPILSKLEDQGKEVIYLKDDQIIWVEDNMTKFY